MKAAAFLAAACLTLGACASGNVQIHSVPPESPAAENAAAVRSEKSAAVASVEAAKSTEPQVQPSDAPSMSTYDPWERMNRFTYRFNARWDESIFLPISNRYRFLPVPVRAGVHNFFANLSEVNSVINFTLQGRLGFGARSLARFLINSTIGIAGLFDVAQKMHLPIAPTGFGTTLAKWGMHPGPYLVIPFLGPSTLRDGFGLLGDFGTSYAVDMGGLYRSTDNSWMLGVANAVDERSNIGFRYYATGSAFEYEAIRFLYVRKRLIEDEALHTDVAPEKRNVDKPAGE